MDTFPKTGMKTEQVRGRLKRYTEAGKKQLAGSMINQVRLHEGEGAANEIKKEFVDINNHSASRLGWSPGYDENWERIFGSGSKKKPVGSETS